jgi:hypothetical protein
VSKILLCQNRVFLMIFSSFFSLQKWRTGFCKNHFDTDHSSVPKNFWKKSPYKVVATFLRFSRALFCNFDTAEFLSIFTRVFEIFEKNRIFTFQKVVTSCGAVLEKFQKFKIFFKKKKDFIEKMFFGQKFLSIFEKLSSLLFLGLSWNLVFYPDTRFL